MARINPIEPEAASAQAKEILSAMKAHLGWVPNLFTTLALSPAALRGYWSFTNALAKGVLSAGLREQIALTVAGRNSCDYCASAHTALAKAAGVTSEEAMQSLAGEAADERTAAALSFAKTLVDERGRVGDQNVEAVRGAGFNDGEIVEIIANVAMNIFTNYFNHVAGTEIDFPLVTTENISAAA